MIAIQLRHIGGGRFDALTPAEAAKAGTLKAGQIVRAQLTQPRSAEQNAYFHWLMGEAFDHRRCNYEITSAEHMKAFVLCAIGHCDVVEFEAGTLSPAAARKLRQRDPYVVFSTMRRSGRVLMRTPKSTSALTMDAFRDVIDRAIDFICRVIVPGTEPEQWAPRSHEERRAA